MSELNVGRPWYEKINVKALGDDVRRKIIEKVKEKLGYNKTVEVLDISKVLYTIICMELGEFLMKLLRRLCST
jgi:hypothetical protein